MKKPTLAFVGMTHLGLISAVGAAEKGFSVLCYDPKNLHPSILEPQLPELLEKNRARLTFSSDLSTLKQCDLVYIAPDIPTNDKGESDLQAIRNLITLILPSLSPQALLIILSQVPPGFTRSLSWNKSQLFYQVETLIFGQAIDRTLYPERFILGMEDPSKPIPALLNHYLSAYGCPLLPMRYESAELSKIAINLFLISSVSTTNTISELAEKIGARWGEIAPALRLDKRIGPHAYLSPGLGIAGGNLERDMATFSKLANQHGTDAGILSAWQTNSRHRANWVLTLLHQELLPQFTSPRIALLGLAYKKNTASVKNSPALALLSHLQHLPVHCYDPAIASLPDYYQQARTFPTALEACKKADIVLIMTPWDEFASLSLEGKIVVDPFGILLKAPKQNYYTLGSPMEKVC